MTDCPLSELARSVSDLENLGIALDGRTPVIITSNAVPPGELHWEDWSLPNVAVSRESLDGARALMSAAFGGYAEPLEGHNEPN